MSRRLSIRGGLVVTPDGVRQTDIEVQGERVAGLGAGGGNDGQVIDATGCYVLPGGVDAHTHLLADVGSGTRSAVFGGTTSALCFTNPKRGESAPAAVIRGRDEVQGQAAIDVDLHAIIGDPDRVTSQDLESLKRLHVRATKVFLAFPEQGLMATDGCLYEVLRAGARLGLVVKVHCENGSVIEALIRGFLAQGRRDAAYFARSRPPEVEDEAIARVLRIARLARADVYITHMTTAGGIELVRMARAEGQRVHAEVCLHHLLLDASLYRGRRAANFLVAPRCVRASTSRRFGQPWRTAPWTLSPPTIRISATSPRQWTAPTSQGCHTASPESSSGSRFYCRRAPGEAFPSGGSPSSAPPDRPSCSASIRARAQSAPGPMPTWWCGIHVINGRSRPQSCMTALAKALIQA